MTDKEIIDTYRVCRDGNSIRESILLTAEKSGATPREVGLLLGFTGKYLNLTLKEKI